MRYVDACQNGDWHLHLWPIGELHDDGTKCERIPYLCRSWRCAGECRTWRASLDWWRIKSGLEKRDDWVYLQLGFRQPEDEFGRWQTYFKAGKAWDKLRKRLTRLYGPLAYVQTWERHKRGGAHVNLVVGNRQVAEAVETDWRDWRRNVLKPHLAPSGFGPVCYVRRVDEQSGRFSWYLTKLANELTGQDVKSQVPTDAPPHFRRIRASRGLLPPKPEPECTGELVKFPIPEYNYSQPAELQPCGCVGRPAQTREETDSATNTSALAETC